MTYLVYTDGASRGNPGPGGWGAIISDGKTVTERGGNERDTTNNRMELTALVEGLKCVLGGGSPSRVSAENGKPEVSVYTDSSYVMQGATGWIHGWKRNGWKTTQKTDVLNKDLWVALDEVLGKVVVDWHHVRGHVGVPGNERCDQIATSYADGAGVELFEGRATDYMVDLRPPSDTDAVAPSTRDRSRAKAHSYLSLIDGVLERHTTWADCEARVKGVAGAKFRKTLSASDEESIRKEWGV